MFLEAQAEEEEEQQQSTTPVFRLTRNPSLLISPVSPVQLAPLRMCKWNLKAAAVAAGQRVIM